MGCNNSTSTKTESTNTMPAKPVSSKTKICIRTLDIEVKADEANTDVLRVCALLRPDWKAEDIVFKNLDGGYINKMIMAKLNTDEKAEDGLVIRICEAGLESLMPGQREKEVGGLVLGAQAGVGPKLLALFKNGLVYEYGRGSNPSWSDLFEIKFVKSMMQTLAKVHAINPEDFEITDDTGKVYGEKSQLAFDPSMVTNLLAAWPESLPDPKMDERFKSVITMTKEEYAAELEMILGKMSSLGEEVITHNDVHVRNMLLDSDTGKVSLVDFEMFSYGFAVSDISRLMWINKKQWQELGFCTQEDREFDDVTRRMWMRCYLEARAELREESPDDVTEEQVESLLLNTRKISLMEALFNILFSLATMGGDVLKFDFFETSLENFQEYMANKHIIMDN